MLLASGSYCCFTAPCNLKVHSLAQLLNIKLLLQETLFAFIKIFVFIRVIGLIQLKYKTFSSWNY